MARTDARQPRTPADAPSAASHGNAGQAGDRPADRIPNTAGAAVIVPPLRTLGAAGTANAAAAAGTLVRPLTPLTPVGLQEHQVVGVAQPAASGAPPAPPWSAIGGEPQPGEIPRELVAIADAVTPAALNATSMSRETLDAAARLLHDGQSPNTRRAYNMAARYAAIWYRLRYAQDLVLPLTVPVAVQFIVDHAESAGPDGQALTVQLPQELDQALVACGVKAELGPPSLATLQMRLTVLSKMHRLQRLPNPFEDVSVVELVRSVRRGYAQRGVRPNKKPALTRTPLQAMLDTCDESLVGLRDRALLLFAWASGGRRRSEVTAARVEDLERDEQDPNTFTFRLLHSKTNQTGRERDDAMKPVTGAAGAALAAWLQASQIVSGPIFRAVVHGKVRGDGLTPATVRNIVLKRAAAAGVRPDFSAHSLRSGFVTEAARQGVPIGDTMAMTGQKSVATVIGYYRAAASLGKAAKLLEGDCRPQRPASPDDCPPDDASVDLI